MDDDALAALQERLQHRFKDPRLLARALTHRSFSAEHNERLEFLGDSVLGLAVSSLLYERLAAAPEGDLTKIRASMVKQEPLHAVALELGLPELLRLGEGEVRTNGRRRPSILADAVEAVIGAVYLDGGFEPASALVRRLYRNVEMKPSLAASAKDAKTQLQEILQARKMELPIYRVVGTLGAAHKQTFDVECEVSELGLVERGIGASRRAGEQAAAAAMLIALKNRAPREPTA
ncbi:MAG: ribonuclease III [Ramlibacter sp.]